MTDSPLTVQMPDAQAEWPSAAHRPTSLRVIRSEWIKQVTLRSVLATAISVLVVIVGFGLVAALVASGDVSSPSRGPAFVREDPLGTVLTGAYFAVLIVAVLGVLTGAREYSSGMIRTTFATVPRRLTVFTAKIVTFTALLLPLVILGVLGAFAGGMSIMANADVESLSWSDDGVARAVLGMMGYLWGIGLLGVATGFLLRSIAGGLAVLLGGLLFIPTLLTALLPDSWDSVLKYVPSNAGSAFTSLTTNDSLLSVGQGIAVFSAWVVVALIAAAAVLKFRDV